MIRSVVVVYMTTVGSRTFSLSLSLSNLLVSFQKEMVTASKTTSFNSSTVATSNRKSVSSDSPSCTHRPNSTKGPACVVRMSIPVVKAMDRELDDVRLYYGTWN